MTSNTSARPSFMVTIADGGSAAPATELECEAVLRSGAVCGMNGFRFCSSCERALCRYHLGPISTPVLCTTCTLLIQLGTAAC